MATKRGPQNKLRLAVIREYRASFNSLEHTAEAFNVSPETMKEWIKRIVNDENPVPSDTWSKTHLERYEKTERFFTGDKEMTMNKDIEGKRYNIQDFIIERGTKLPDTPVTKKPYGYQVIIKGTERGKTRKVTTPIAIDISSAMSSARKMMGEYKRFKGQIAYIRVFSPR